VNPQRLERRNVTTTPRLRGEQKRQNGNPAIIFIVGPTIGEASSRNSKTAAHLLVEIFSTGAVASRRLTLTQLNY
jgi:hypothetical protein